MSPAKPPKAKTPAKTPAVKRGAAKAAPAAKTPSPRKAMAPAPKATVAPAPQVQADAWIARALEKLRVGSPSDRAVVMGEAPTTLVEAARSTIGLKPSQEGGEGQDVVITGAHLDQAALSALPRRLAEVRAALKSDGLLIARLRTFSAPEAKPQDGGAWDHLLFPAMTRSGEIAGVAAGLTPLFISGWVMALETAGFRLLALAGPNGEATAETLLGRHAERLAVFDTREIAATELLVIARAAA